MSLYCIVFKDGFECDVWAHSETLARGYGASYHETTEDNIQCSFKK